MFIKLASTVLSFALMTSLISAPNIEPSSTETHLSYISESDAMELANQCIAAG